MQSSFPPSCAVVVVDWAVWLQGSREGGVEVVAWVHVGPESACGRSGREACPQRVSQVVVVV